MSLPPLVAIVGAPNVGKSRLFNRLTGKRSIVHDRPGVTRDRIEAICRWSGRRFRVQDTGGLVPAGTDELTRVVERQVQKAMAQANLLLFVVDARSGILPLDESLARLLRRSGAPVVLVINKVDTERMEDRIGEFFSLGFREPVGVSAESGRGVGELLDRLLEELPAAETEPEGETPSDSRIRLAIVGRPNVGKSTLFNRLAGEERAVVSAVPGTTRDPVEAEFTHRGRRYALVDTAGLRRRARAEREPVELESVDQALAALKAADLAVALFDISDPATHQDRAVVGACLKVQRPLVVALNKADRLSGREALEQAGTRAREALHFSPEVPLVPISAATGQGVARLLDRLELLARESSRRFPTPELNAALHGALRRRTPAGRERIPRLSYVTQTGNFPLSFVIFTNGVRIDDAYRRFLIRHFRTALGLQLAPVALRFRRKN